LLERIDAFLGHPTVDPHGDPIPTHQGEIREPAPRHLAESKIGDHVCIIRVLDQREAFLRFIDSHNLRPGSIVTVEAKDPVGDAMTISTGKGPSVTMGTAAAMKLLVESDGSTSADSA